MSKGPNSDRFARRLFFFSAGLLLFGYGFAVAEFKIFPYRIICLARDGVIEVDRQLTAQGLLPSSADLDDGIYYYEVGENRPSTPSSGERACNGLNLVTRMDAGLKLAASLVDMDGQVVQEWDVDWFRAWPDAEHLPPRLKPKSPPGAHVHGAVVLENGDLVFNYEHLGLVRLNRDSEVVWRLPYQTHHSVHLHDDGRLWVCGQELHTEADPRFPQRRAPFDEYTLLEVSTDGEILGKWSVPELLHENGMAGLLQLSSARPHPQIAGDLLHLNDVEPFPESMQEDFFRRGDILVSLRNVNTVFVFNRETRRIGFSCTGWFVAQHDPDFIDGNTFSVFDNNQVRQGLPGSSRIVIVSARERRSEVFFEGSPERPFYSRIMGKHQWLPNGNLLVTESCRGRAFELTPEREIVWEYENIVANGLAGLVEQVDRLPYGRGGYLASD